MGPATEVAVSSRTLVVGRGVDADIPVADTSVSTRHAELTLTSDGRLYVTDCGSRNGTFVEDGGRREPIRQGVVPVMATLHFGSCAIPARELLAILQQSTKAAERVEAGSGFVRCSQCAAPRRRGVACHVCGAGPSGAG